MPGIFVLLCLFVCYGAKAQLEERIKGAKQGVQIMVKQFNLSAEQAELLDKLNVGFEMQMDSLNQSKLKNAQVGELRKKLMRDREADLEKLFTKEQYESYVKFIEQNKPVLPPATLVNWEDVLRESGKDPIIDP